MTGTTKLWAVYGRGPLPDCPGQEERESAPRRRRRRQVKGEGGVSVSVGGNECTESGPHRRGGGGKSLIVIREAGTAPMYGA